MKQYESLSDFIGLVELSGLFLLFGYMMRFLSEGYAALKPAFLSLDLRHEESAQTLGATPWRIFRRITLPAIKPGMKAAYLLLFIAIAKRTAHHPHAHASRQTNLGLSYF